MPPPAIEEAGRPSLLCGRRTESVCSCRGQCPCARRRYRYRFGCTRLPRFRHSAPSSLLCGARALFSLPFLCWLCFCVAMTCPTSCTIPLPPPSATTQRAPARSHAHAHRMPWSGRTSFFLFSFSCVLLPLRLLAFIVFGVSPRFLGLASDPPPPLRRHARRGVGELALSLAASLALVLCRDGRSADRLSIRRPPSAPLCRDRLGAFAVLAFRLAR